MEVPKKFGLYQLAYSILVYFIHFIICNFVTNMENYQKTQTLGSAFVVLSHIFSSLAKKVWKQGRNEMIVNDWIYSILFKNSFTEILTFNKLHIYKVYNLIGLTCVYVHETIITIKIVSIFTMFESFLLCALCSSS